MGNDSPYQILEVSNPPYPDEQEVIQVIKSVDVSNADCIDALIDLSIALTEAYKASGKLALLPAMMNEHLLTKVALLINPKNPDAVNTAACTLLYELTSEGHVGRIEQTPRTAHAGEILTEGALSGDKNMAEACVSALVEWLKSDSDHLSSLSSNLFFISAPSYIQCDVKEDVKEGKIVLIKKTRMVQLLAQLLRNDIIFPFASEIVGAAEEMQKTCKDHKTGALRSEWKELDKELYALMSEAEDKEIEAQKAKEENSNPALKEVETEAKLKQLEEALREKEEALKAKEKAEKENKELKERIKHLEEEVEKREKERNGKPPLEKLLRQMARAAPKEEKPETRKKKNSISFTLREGQEPTHEEMTIWIEQYLQRNSQSAAISLRALRHEMEAECNMSLSHRKLEIAQIVDQFVPSN